MADNDNSAAANEAAQPATTFDIRKIYLKDSSVESPNAPMIFLQEPVKPEISIDASIKSSALDPEDYYEVILGLTVTSKMGDQTAFLVEVHQAGVFQVAKACQPRKHRTRRFRRRFRSTTHWTT